MTASLHVPPERFCRLVGNFRPADSYIVQFAIAHDSELMADVAALAPHPHHGQHSAAEGEC
jgi:hypothetical protein